MRILMVCLGNICRSPMADAWLRQKSDLKGLNLTIDSAGTANYHIGKQPDTRMCKYAAEYGVDLTPLRARQFQASDFDKFDLIYVMDASNLSNVLQLAKNEIQQQKVKLLLNELYPGEDQEVPDPYYGDRSDFIAVIELLDKATDAVLSNHNLI